VTRPGSLARHLILVQLVAENWTTTRLGVERMGMCPGLPLMSLNRVQTPWSCEPQ